MSNITLITVQSKDNKNASVVKDLGLTKHLGYNPYFCIKIDHTSLAETWFKLWTMFSVNPVTICLFQIDESECTPINLLDWKNLCSESDFSADSFAAILNDANPLTTNYLVKEIPENRITISVAALLYDTEIYRYALGSSYEEKEAICDMFKTIQEHCISVAKQLKERFGKKYSDEKILFDVLRVSGIVSFLYQIATGNSVTSSLYTIIPADLSCASLVSASDLLTKWNNLAESNDTFTLVEYETMRKEFLAALNVAAKSVSAKTAKQNGIGRNDLCSCGSGKKFKHCHAVKGMDDMIFIKNDLTELV